MNSHPSIGFVAALAMLTTSVSFAHGDTSHAPKARQYVGSEVVDTDFGRQGDPSQVTRTISIDMNDNMRFSPGVLVIRRGDTVRLDVANKGRLLHELVLGSPENLQAHGDAMKKYPGMQHEEPHMVHVEPGRTGEMVWHFTRAGAFQFACLLPGHFEAGMAGKVIVR